MATLTWLRVHTVLTAEAGDAMGIDQCVHCPQENQYVSLDSCVSCRNMFAMDRRDRDTYVVCDVADGHEVPREEVVSGLRGVVESGQPATTVADAMHADVLCVEPDVPLTQLLDILLAHGISGMPVVKDGEPIGVVSKTDVVRSLSGALSSTPPRSMAGMTVADIMAPLVFAIPPDAPLERAAALMAFEGVHRLPVVSSGKLVGVLTSIDVLRWVARSTGFVIPGHTKLQ